MSLVSATYTDNQDEGGVLIQPSIHTAYTEHQGNTFLNTKAKGETPCQVTFFGILSFLLFLQIFLKL